MQLRHISPRSSDWVDAMDEGGRGWDKLAPEERSKLRLDEYASVWGREGSEAQDAQGGTGRTEENDYGWSADSASR
jgi:hypothetical protein